MSKDTVRLSVDCSEEERRRLKIFCTLSGYTISQWVMAAVREKMRNEAKHLPNKKTSQALTESEQGKGVRRYDDIEELFEDLGI